MSHLSEFIHQIIKLERDEIDQINSSFKEVHVQKGELWVAEGSVCREVAFLISGKLRSYYYDNDGNEITCFFVTPDNFISSFTSFLTETPTLENIIAIEDSTLQVISKKELERLSTAVPKIQVLRRIIAENLFILMEKRIALLQSNSANERYEKMLQENPDIILSVPLQYVASFLGITPQHFSRLRKNAGKGNS